MEVEPLLMFDNWWGHLFSWQNIVSK